MRVSLIILFLCVFSTRLAAQPLPDSVMILYNAAKTDSGKGKCLSDYLRRIREDDNFLKITAELNRFFKTNNDPAGQDYIQLSAARYLSMTGDFTSGLKQSLQIRSRFQARKDNYGIVAATIVLGTALYFSGNVEESIITYKNAIPAALLVGDKKLLSELHNNLASDYEQIHLPDSGLIYAQQAVRYNEETGDAQGLSVSLGTVGEIYIAKKEYDIAIPFIKKSYTISKDLRDYSTVAWDLNDLSQIFLERNHQDSARYYARQAVELSGQKGFKDQLLRAYGYLYKSFEQDGTKDSVYKYFRLAITTKDSLFSTQKVKEIQVINFREQMREQEIEQEKIKLRDKVRTYALLGALGMFSIIAFIFYRNNRQKQTANKILEATLANLRSTQSQLVQQEKMASLGELTAGIAHEIQNPLNFVNNFSEVNRELIEDLKEEIKTGDPGEALSIANNIDQNLNKILVHGKRADAIVKGMLQHSSKSTGQKEAADLNDMVDEYLRLSYHGLRAKDKSFNVILETHFDPAVMMVPMVRQDIGRVLLNLFNNAFYSVMEKKSLVGAAYEAVLAVSTQKKGDNIQISVRDNGMGIPPKVLDKIYQPFFTTKPTGEGTGLGLSLSYDIITKGHSGEMHVMSDEGEGAEFKIHLPLA
jgi:two-component system, NtrC family, sensor kinase